MMARLNRSTITVAGMMRRNTTCFEWAYSTALNKSRARCSTDGMGLGPRSTASRRLSPSTHFPIRNAQSPSRPAEYTGRIDG